MRQKGEIRLKKDQQPDLDEHACYVLLTCGHPNGEGKMTVEMTYEGDPSLAAFLLESAQSFIEQDESISDPPCA